MYEPEIKLELESWRGYSAYEVAVQNGFNGTKTEWLESLVGGTIQLTVNGKAMETDGDIKLYAGDIPMEAGALNTVKSKINALEEMMGRKVSMQTDTASLSASGWSDQMQTAAVEGVMDDSVVIVTPAPGTHAKYTGCGVRCTAQGVGTKTFSCTTVNDSDVEANILILMGG